jgi:predicted deacylase
LAHFRVDAGDWVDRGALMLTIRDVYGDVVEEVRAPEQGYIRSVLFGPHNAAVYEGAIVAAILIVDPGRRYFHD